MMYKSGHMLRFGRLTPLQHVFSRLQVFLSHIHFKEKYKLLSDAHEIILCVEQESIVVSFQKTLTEMFRLELLFKIGVMLWEL